MGWEVKIDMSGQSNDCLWVCNVKMKKFLPGQKLGTFLRSFRFGGYSIKRFENFFMGFGVPISLTVVDISWQISSRSRWGTWMHTADGCISGLILLGSFSNQFKQGLGDYYGCFMLIRRGAQSFKCDFLIFEILENFLSWLGAILWYYGEGFHLDSSVISWNFFVIFLLKKGLIRG